VFYPADPFLVRKLREIESSLDLKWNPEVERWEVWDSKPGLTSCGELNGGLAGYVRPVPYLVFRWQGPKGEYRGADSRILAKMAMVAAQRNGGYRAMLRVLDEHNHRISDKRKQDMVDRLTYQTKQDFRHWQRFVSEDLGVVGEKENTGKVYLNGAA
jgi:hypothetical protein